MKFSQHLSPDYVATLKTKTIRNRMNELAGTFLFDKEYLSDPGYWDDNKTNIVRDEMNMAIYSVELFKRGV
mgnify:CR=1 FL=1